MGRSVFGSDLPPGCRVSDIPGNRPEDEKWDAIISGFWDKERKPEHKEALDEAPQVYVDLIDEAIEYGMDIGMKEEAAIENENKGYLSLYHQQVRNPKLRKFFREQRQTIRELQEEYR